MIRTQGLDRRLMYWVVGKMYAERTSVFPSRGGLKRILLVRVDERVGNLIMIQALLDALKAHLPAVSLGLWSSVRMRRVTESLEGVDQLHEIDKRWFFRCPWRWANHIRSVRDSGYQVAIDASAWHAFSLTHAVLTHFSGAPMTIGYQRDAGAQEVAIEQEDGFHTHLVRPGPDDEQELRQHMRLLGPLGIHTGPPMLRTTLGKGQSESWQRWLEAKMPVGPRIAIWPGARKSERRWSHSNFVLLAKRLQKDLGAGVLVLWGPGEEGLREKLQDGLKPFGIATPPTSLSALAGVMREMDLVVTNDTGPMHLAVAVGAPTLVVFPSGEPRRWGHDYTFVENIAVPERVSENHLEGMMQACRRLLMTKKR